MWSGFDGQEHCLRNEITKSQKADSDRPKYDDQFKLHALKLIENRLNGKLIRKMGRDLMAFCHSKDG